MGIHPGHGRSPMIRECRIIAIEGSHGSGKSTLVHALCATLKAEGHVVGSQLETARENPIIEATRIHGRGEVDVFGQLSLFGTKLTQEALQARYNEMLITDKTVMNVLGYARLLIADATAVERDLLDAVASLCRAYAACYDVVFYSQDLYDTTLTADPFRPSDREFQAAADRSIRTALDAVSCQPVEIPLGLSLAQRVEFVLSHPRTAEAIYGAP